MITTILPNGLTLMSCQFKDPDDNISITFHIDVGFRDDKIDGTSHFVEHMLFEGTETRSVKDIRVLYRKLNYHVDANTSDICTQYTITTNYQNLETAIDLLSDMIQNSIFDPKRLEFERKAIKCEMSRRCDDNNLQLTNLFFNGLGVGEGINNEASIKALKDINRDVLLKHYKQYYIPNNTTIFVSGSFDQEKLESIVQEKTKDWIAGDIGERKAAPEKFHGDFRKKLDMKQCFFDISFKGEKQEATKEYFIGRLGVEIFFNDYLIDFTRTDNGLNYEISFNFARTPYYGYWGIRSNTDCESINDLIEVIGEAFFSRIANLTEDDIEHAKENLKNIWSEAPKSIFECNDNMEMKKYFKCSVDDAVKMIDAITLDDIKKWFEGKLKSDDIIVTAIGDIDNMYTYEEIVNMTHNAAYDIFVTG